METMPVRKSFEDQFYSLPEKLRSDLEIKFDVTLANSEIADVAIYREQNCIALGQLVTKKLVLDKKKSEVRKLFHGDEKINPFLECGTHSNFWFYFDGVTLVLNDHNYIYPFDEYMETFIQGIKRITKALN